MPPPDKNAIWGPGVGPRPKTDNEIFRAELLRAASDGRAGTYVVFPYCVSLAILSFKRTSHVIFIAQGSSRILAGLPYLLVSLLVGWWGIPWGIIWTLQSIKVCVEGGRDLTPVINLLRAGLAAETVASPESRTS